MPFLCFTEDVTPVIVLENVGRIWVTRRKEEEAIVCSVFGPGSVRRW